MNICIYGAASNRIDKTFIDQTEELGRKLAENGHSLIYGAGATGLMGASARGFKKGNGEIIGVAPHFMHTIEPLFEDCTRLIETDTMAKRKTIMEEKADVFVIAPGGIGTLDEFFQALTLKELGRLNKPIVIYNINNFYTKLIDCIDDFIDKGFVSERVAKSYEVVTTPEELLDILDPSVYVILEENSNELQRESKIAELPGVFETRKAAVEYLHNRVEAEVGCQYFPYETAEEIEKNGSVCFYYRDEEDNPLHFTLTIHKMEVKK